MHFSPFERPVCIWYSRQAVPELRVYIHAWDRATEALALSDGASPQLFGRRVSVAPDSYFRGAGSVRAGTQEAMRGLQTVFLRKTRRDVDKQTDRLDEIYAKTCVGQHGQCLWVVTIGLVWSRRFTQRRVQMQRLPPHPHPYESVGSSFRF